MDQTVEDVLRETFSDDEDIANIVTVLRSELDMIHDIDILNIFIDNSYDSVSRLRKMPEARVDKYFSGNGTFL